MTYEEAEAQGLDVFHFGTTEARAEFAANVREEERPCFEFEPVVAGFTLIALAITPRISNRVKFGL